MRIRVQRAYEKSLQIHKKRLAAKARAKAERLASAQAEAVTAESFSKHPQALTSHLAPAADLGEGSVSTESCISSVRLGVLVLFIFYQSKSPLTHPAPEVLPRLTPPPPLPHPSHPYSISAWTPAFVFKKICMTSTCTIPRTRPFHKAPTLLKFH